MTLWSRRLGLFFIGCMAGFAPFATMTVLPAVVSPGTDVATMDWTALVLLSLIVGVVTAIFFERAEKVLPREVFIAALGIPTMFIGTVANMSARFDAARTADRASYALEQSPDVTPAPEGLTPFTPPASNPASTSWLPSLVGVANAQILIAQAVTPVHHAFLVVVGSFRDQKVAIAEYRRLQRTTLRSERYAPKSLNIYKGANGIYLVTYARAETMLQAQRIYRLLLINDPRLSPRVVEIGS